jgi:N-acylneuraminate cytidylyltransferase
MTKIAIIPARSGSKGLKNKNILNLCGKPLVAYSIEAAIKSNLFDKVIVSTDSLEYKDISLSYGATVIMRNDELSNDKATSYMVIKDVLEKINASQNDEFILLQPTSPLRTSQNIIEAYDLFDKHKYNYDFLVSMSESEKSNALIQIIDDNTLKNFDLDFKNYSRQQYKEYYPNGAIFIGKVGAYLGKGDFFGCKSLPYYMLKEESVDIDDVIDFQLAITLINNKQCRKIIDKSIDIRIKDKKPLFSGQGEILLLGHSILDNWDIERLDTYKICNYGISGITIEGYYHKIIEKNYLNNVPDICFLMFGINDIKYGVEIENISFYLQKIIDYLKMKNSNTKIHVIDILNVNGNIYLDNEIIDGANDYIHKHITNMDGFVSMKGFNNDYGKLSLEYTYDGVHLNNNGYNLLNKLLYKNLQY